MKCEGLPVMNWLLWISCSGLVAVGSVAVGSVAVGSVAVGSAPTEMDQLYSGTVKLP